MPIKHDGRQIIFFGQYDLEAVAAEILAPFDAGLQVDKVTSVTKKIRLAHIAIW